MKKKIYLVPISLFLAVSVLLTACISKDAEQADDTPVDTTASIEEAEIPISDYVILPDYKTLDLNTELVTYTDEDVVQYIASITEGIPVTDRVASAGDLVHVSYCVMDEDENIVENNDNFSILLGSGSAIDGFESGIIGMNIGDKKNIELSYPEMDNESLSGKTVPCSITLLEIYTPVSYYDIDDNSFSTLETGYESKEDYEAAILEEMEVNAFDDYSSSAKDEIAAYLTANSHFVNIPDELLKEFISSYTSYMDLVAVENGYSNYLEYCKTSLSMTDYEYNVLINETATDSLKNYLIYESIIESEDIQIGDDLISSNISDLSAEYGFDSEEEFLSIFGDVVSRSYIIKDYVLDFLFNNSNIQ